jgi:MSHA biogenesis protein MshO
MMTGPTRSIRRRAAGVTLIELAITIALVGIIGALVVQFVWPVRSYIDSSRRAALADTADTALRRIGRDLHLALPNSVRVTTTGTGPTTVYYLELLLVRTGGRYRADVDSGASNTCTGGYANDVLSFGAADDCFKTLGNLYATPADITTQVVANSDYVVVFNLQPGTTGADAYSTTCGSTCNKSLISEALNFAGEDRIKFASNTFTYESPGSRFFIVEGAVSYVCDPPAGTLTRRWGYTIAASQPTSFTDGSNARLADNVSGCSFTYDANVSAGTGLATLALTLSIQSSQGTPESVSLYHAVHVNNVP